jgi:hypothetical protein
MEVKIFYPLSEDRTFVVAHGLQNQAAVLREEEELS